MRLTKEQIEQLLTTEFGRLVAMFILFYFIIKPLKKDLHLMVEKMNKIYLRMESQKETNRIAEENKAEIYKLKEKIHSIELNSIK